MSKNDLIEIRRQFQEKTISPTVKLQSLASTLHLNSSYFSRIFSKECGITFRQAKLDSQISHAMDLLLDKSLSIKSIAYQLGYKYEQSFTRSFKESTGMTPSAYRKQI